MLIFKKIRIFCVTFVLSLAFVGSAVASSPEQQYSDAENAEFNKRLKEALVNDPEILKAAIIALQASEKAKSAERSVANIDSQYDELFTKKNDPWIGAESPELTIAYFGDFNCGYCKRIEPILAKLVDEYPQVRVVFKLVPILGGTSKDAAELALTVWEKDQAKFEALHAQMMTNKGRLTTEQIATLSQQTQTQTWLNNTSMTAVKSLESNVALMQAFNLTGTPSLIFDDQIVGGLLPYEQLEAKVKTALAKNK